MMIDAMTPPPAQATEPKPVALSPERWAALRWIGRYLARRDGGAVAAAEPGLGSDELVPGDLEVE